MRRVGYKQLTEAKARAILRDARPCPTCGARMPEKALAARHGTTSSTVCRLLTGQHRYSNLDPEEDA